MELIRVRPTYKRLLMMPKTMLYFYNTSGGNFFDRIHNCYNIFKIIMK